MGDGPLTSAGECRGSNARSSRHDEDMTKPSEHTLTELLECLHHAVVHAAHRPHVVHALLIDDLET